MSVEKYNTADIKYVVIDNGSTNKECIERINHFCWTPLWVIIKELLLEENTSVYLKLLFVPIRKIWAMHKEIISD